MKEFGGRVAVVTGAAGGMGCALTEHCAQDSMQTVLADGERTALNQSKAELRTEGTTVLTVPKDIPRRTP